MAAKPNVAFGASPNKPSFILGSSNTMTGAGSVTNSNGAGAGTGTGTGSNANSITDSTSYRAPFSMQFSAATEMILKRLRGEGGPLNPSTVLGLGAGGAVQPPGYEDVRRSVLQGMKTTLNMDLPATTPTLPKKGARPSTARISTPTISTPTASALINLNVSASTVGGSGGRVGIGGGTGSANRGKISAKSGKARAGNKRKRAKDESESEVSDAMSGLGGDSDSEGAGSVTHLPTQTLSGRKVVKPTQFSPAAVEGPSRKRGGYKRTGRSVDQALCKRCGRGHSPASNMIVFCDGCNLGWHQMCHDPMVSDELVRDESKEWFCNDCTAKREKIPKPDFQIGGDSGWAGKSVEERRAYLSTFPQSHLVTLLIQAATLHSDIPIFPPLPLSIQTAQQHQSTQQQNSSRPTEKRVTHYPQQPFPPSATSTAGLFARAEANPNAQINFIRKITPGDSTSSMPQLPSSFIQNPKGSHITNPLFQGLSTVNVTLDDDADGDEESRESTPASPPYPRPGNGLMAKLPPDDQDLEWLVGEGEDDTAFSHVVFAQDGQAQQLHG